MRYKRVRANCGRAAKKYFLIGTRLAGCILRLMPSSHSPVSLAYGSGPGLPGSIIDDLRLPPGLTATVVAMALEIPTIYQGAQVDMFYVAPVLLLANGARSG
jgi:hypothetical protein